MDIEHLAELVAEKVFQKLQGKSDIRREIGLTPEERKELSREKVKNARRATVH